MRPSVRNTGSRLAAGKRSAAAVASLAAAAALLAAGGSASAAPAPTVASVQARISAIDTQASKLGQQYDQAKVSLAAARRRLVLLNRSEARYRAHFNSLRAQVGRIAATAYEDGSLTSPTALLTSGQPQQVLNQSSILGEMSATNGTQIHQFLAAARQLTGAQQAAKRTETGIAQLEKSLGSRYSKLNTLKSQQETLLAQLTPAQRQQAEPGGGSTSTGTTPTKESKVPASGQAAAAMAYAYSKIGDPYVWGATGPSEFDCSGLMMAAWAAAGVSIPRTSWAQMESLPSVPLNDLQPGDILGFSGNDHVGMYVGGGYLIDAPVPGAYVEKVPLSGWYQENLDGAVRP